MGRTSDAKERLIAAMAELVHRRGYVDVGVDDVCKAAGVQKGSFYYFFKSKRDLMLAALDRHWCVGREHFGAAFLGQIPPLERIERLFAILATLEAANRQSTGHVLGCPFGNVAAEVGSSDPVLAKRADDAFCGLAGFLREALHDAQARGQLPRNVDLHEAADALVAYFEGIALLAKTRNDPSLIRRLGARAVQLAIQPSLRSARRQGARRKKTDASLRRR
jgi:TetR/AcrR family transcriptional repressor of nem operon